MVAVLAMAGDLCSSFIKRRLGIKSSDKATGLDQIPESAFPLLYLSIINEMTFAYSIVGIILFTITEPFISRILFRIGIRQRPY